MSAETTEPIGLPPDVRQAVMADPYWVMRESLLAFTQYTFEGYQVSWHHREIANALEDVERGKCKRLIVTIRPQVGKSELVSVRFPVYSYSRDPDKRIILTSYSAETAERYSRDARDIVRSEAYAQVFPNNVLSPEAQGLAFWKFTKGRGYVRATGVGGPITSYGADLFIIDDPIKDREEAESELVRNKIWDWYLSVALSRLSRDAACVIVMTRWHEDDPVGRLLKTQPGMWRVLSIPAVDEESGRIVWPERWSMEDYKRLRQEVGRREWDALYQGNPVPPEGALFKRNWFTISPRAPEGLRWIRAWDLATSEKKSASHTCGVQMAVDSTKTIWIRGLVRGQWDWPQARRRIITTADKEGPDVHVFIEKGAYQFGKLAEDLIDNWENIRVPIRSVRVQGLGDKEARANPWAARAEAGRVCLVKSGDPQDNWIEVFLDEVCAFPYGKHTDIVDCVSLGFHVLANERLGAPSELIRAPRGTVAYWKQLAAATSRKTPPWSP